MEPERPVPGLSVSFLVFRLSDVMVSYASRAGDATARIWSVPESRAADVKSAAMVHQAREIAGQGEKSKDVTTLDWNVC